MQIRIQQLLPEVIHPGQSAFLPSRHILDTIMTQQETISWANESEQPLIMLKLDFRKAYDTVSWSFLFSATDKMGIPKRYTDMIRMLLSNANAAVSINGSISKSFPICRGVRQGCPIAPYLFLLVAEALATVSAHEVAQGRLRGIQLPEGGNQHVLTQFADDATYSLFGAPRYLTAASDILTEFGLATGLEINRSKCGLYWFGNDPPPRWLASFGCSIAPPGTLSKLLGTPFGVSLATTDVDQFLAGKIKAKLKYWSSIHLSLAARAVVVNSVLLSTLWYFISVWGGSTVVLRKIRASLRNYLWAGTEEASRARVRWEDVYAAKKFGGLGIIDPEEALIGLMGKWVVKALVPDNTPLHLLLRHRLAGVRPPGTGNWPRTLQWLLLTKFSAPQGSRVWNRLIQSWRALSPLIDATPPTNFKEIQNTNIWWTTQFLGHNFGFPQARARQLARKGLNSLRELWQEGSMALRPWEDLKLSFGFHDDEEGLVDHLQTLVPPEWITLGQATRSQATQGDWLGVFSAPEGLDPIIVFQSTDVFRPELSHQELGLTIPCSVPIFSVGPQTRSLNATARPGGFIFMGRVMRVRVVQLLPAPAAKEITIYKYLAPLTRLRFDPGRWQWRPGEVLYHYTAKRGRQWRKPRETLSLPISSKLAGLVPAAFQPNWRAVWNPGRPRKEAAFVWSFMHRAIAVNQWRHVANNAISELCVCCDENRSETLVHAFHECHPASIAWNFALSVLCRMQSITRAQQDGILLSWQQCLMDKELPIELQDGTPVWSLFRR